MPRLRTPANPWARSALPRRLRRCRGVMTRRFLSTCSSLRKEFGVDTMCGYSNRNHHDVTMCRQECRF